MSLVWNELKKDIIQADNKTRMAHIRSILRAPFTVTQTGQEVLLWLRTRTLSNLIIAGTGTRVVKMPALVIWWWSSNVIWSNVSTKCLNKNANLYLDRDLNQNEKDLREWAGVSMQAWKSQAFESALTSNEKSGKSSKQPNNVRQR